MASRRVAAIRQGDLGVDRKQAQVQALPDIDLYSRWGICALLGPGGVASSVHDRILGFSFPGSINFTVNKLRELPSDFGKQTKDNEFSV
ncbi:hypothetical protein EJB05_54264 [Eragrostis curvula]|uniref:Uncharacterized protein n=1 Tax=Eragrostis curvula TaxID=38414 RepID=A0A5J9SMT6_9POAL|nr:hypothetical protein EJB05_54264 [Eragrostis curvula]